ncbi:MAG TPA: nitrite reductase (NAD(P)H) small subunit [Pseudohongiella sp.]|nr:nitrite reductase (NAD(P)H) small subunit [Pseudohongiella sp.]HBX36258.1 nitrite reductase (NAD(P)H) small subunit [Pseudohongiella sp.]|tara:strand:+ start:21816 stop:22175 length:360 start_codon:yes stop_codon:yes gene_type:complete
MSQQMEAAAVQRSDWFDIADLDQIVPGTGAAARLGKEQVAIFNTRDGIFAVQNHDPFSGANVLSRGIVGDIGGRLVVASPVYKQHFCLRSGECLEDGSVRLQTFAVTVRDSRVWIAAGE